MGQGIGAVRRRRPPRVGWLAGLLAGAALAAGVGPASAAAAQAGCSVRDVRGMTVESAEGQIQSDLKRKDPSVTFKLTPSPPDGLAWDRVFVRSYDVSGCHVEQARSSVTVYLSTGAKVPGVAGRTRADAEVSLRQAGLVADPRPPDAEADWVAVPGQSPAPEALTRFGAPVTFPLQPGTGTTGTVTVPDLGGLTEAEARRRLGKELRLAVVQAAGREPVVIRQDPRPRATAKRGDVVRVRLGKPPGGSSTSSSTSSSAGAGGGTRGTGGTGDTGRTGGSGGPDGEHAGDTTPASIGTGLRSLLGLLVVVLVAMAAAVSGRRVMARRSSRRPSRAPGRVHAEPHADPVPDVSAGVAGAGPSLTVRLQPHGDPGTQWLGEGPR